MRKWLAAFGFLALMVPATLWATTQMEDVIYLEGVKHPLHSLPLEQYFGAGHPRPPLRAPHTALWRGYLATWEIKEGLLYLKHLEAWTATGKTGMAAVFPDRQGPVPATWFTGELRIPQGKAVKPYVPYPLYEKYLLISVEKGRVVGRRVVNQPLDPKAPRP